MPLTETQAWVWKDFKQRILQSQGAYTEFKYLNPHKRVDRIGHPLVPTHKLSMEQVPYRKTLSPNRVIEHIDFETMRINSELRLAERSLPPPRPRESRGPHKSIPTPEFPESLRRIMRKYWWIEWLPEGITFNTSNGCGPYSSMLDFKPYPERETWRKRTVNKTTR